VTLNDLASKNGTFVNGVRVNDSMSLGERADIQLGSLSIQFVRLGDISTTETLDLLPAERSLLRESR
jgi:pSer/pThr/pTyr-binding forkhead associated (FHA) protein